MNPIFIGPDKFVRRNKDEWLELGLNATYEITLEPRCTPLPCLFAHPCAVQFYALNSRVSFELNGLQFELEPGQIVCVEAHELYRMMGREFSAVTVLCQAISPVVEKDWRRMGQFLLESKAPLAHRR